MTFEADKFLEDVTGRFAKPYTQAIHDLYVAKVRGNRPMQADARAALQKAMLATMAVAEVFGARLLLRAAAKLIADTADTELAATFAADRESASTVPVKPQTMAEYLRAQRDDLWSFADQTILPSVTLTEALDDMVSRTPVTIRRAAERTAQRISQLYSENRTVAFARAAEASVTKEAQRFITRALREGVSAGEAGRALSMTVNAIREQSAAWSEGYARTVFRTNVNTAITAGRFRQAQDPDIKGVIPAFRFDSVGDSDTRSNHDAADGMILRVDNPAWNKLAPPLGYNCRCQVSLAPLVELEAMGRVNQHGEVIESRVPGAASPDAGFRHGGRPDLFIVAGGR